MKSLVFRLIVLAFTCSFATANATGNLLFKSSFDHDVVVDKTVSWNHHLRGLDSTTGYYFPDDLPGDTPEHFFNYVVGDMDHYSDYANAEIVSTQGYDGNPTNALFINFIQDDPDFTSYSRVQYAMYGDPLSNDPIQRMNQGYVKYRIKTHLDHSDEESDWRLPVEWKDMDDDGFRMGLYIYDTDTPSPYWVAKGQYMIDGELGEDVWQFDNYDIPVTEDDWFELEFFWYGHPDPALGQLKVAINGEILFDVTAQTKDPAQPDKIFYFMPFKVYGAVGYSWITDFEYWDAPPADSILAGTLLSGVGDPEVSGLALSPNPFNPATVISYSLPSSTQVQLTVYDLRGRQIASLVNSVQAAGPHAVRFDGQGLPSGIYFYRLVAGSLRKSGKMVLVN